MPNQITLVIPGSPVPLQRPRFGKNNVFDSQKKIKDVISLVIRQQICDKDTSSFTGPVSIDFKFYMKIPASYLKTRKQKLLGKPHIKRPDIDNLIKFVCDVCNDLLYKDDAQVYTLSATKLYSNEPRTVVKIRQEAIATSQKGEANV